MVLARAPFLLGLVAVALAFSGCGQASPENEHVQAVKRLITLAEQPGSWAQKDVSRQAREIFTVGETAESYAPMLTSLGFKKYINRVQGRRSVSFSKDDLTAPGSIIGRVELRFVLPTGDDDRIQSVVGKIFLHTL
jgi:hypothetical protein